ncbi:MAG: hypothetical protein ACE148_15940 [Vicinamibacterales bacterium]
MGEGHHLTDGRRASWVKVKNAAYSQVEGSHELFEGRRSVAGHAALRKPELVLA